MEKRNWEDPVLGDAHWLKKTVLAYKNPPGVTRSHEPGCLWALHQVSACLPSNFSQPALCWSSISTFHRWRTVSTKNISNPMRPSSRSVDVQHETTPFNSLNNREEVSRRLSYIFRQSGGGTLKANIPDNLVLRLMFPNILLIKNQPFSTKRPFTDRYSSNIISAKE